MKICSQKNISFVKQCGADNILIYDNKQLTIKEQLNQFISTNNKFDIILDTVTSNDYTDRQYKY